MEKRTMPTAVKRCAPASIDQATFDLLTLAKAKGFRNLRILAESSGVTYASVKVMNRGFLAGVDIRRRLAQALNVSDEEIVRAIRNAYLW